MPDERDHCWYLAEAARLREKADAVGSDEELRDRYINLALEYERLANILQHRGSA